jgi:hypothetical protein
VGARLAWTEGSVRRIGDGAFASRTHALWGAVRTEALVGGGRLELALGGGRHDAVRRFEMIPSLTYRRRARGLDGELRFERLVTPVGSDLAVGQAPFLQRAWVATLQAVRADSGSWGARASLRLGRVYQRAVATREPLEDLWLRGGLRAQYGTYDFALADAGLGWRARHAEAGLEGFAQAHRTPTDTVWAVGVSGPERVARADPDAGFRAWLAGSARLFGGDLGVRLRGEVAGMGTRELPGPAVRRLPGFTTFTAAADLTLGDATIVVRARNLEDRPREESWVDSSTGLPAVGGRRELRLTLVWRLFN